MTASEGLTATALDVSCVPGLDLGWLSDLLVEALSIEGLRHGHIDLRVLAEAEMATLNLKFMGKDEPTDVLSFPLDADEADADPGDGPPRQFGDIVICRPVAMAQAAAQGHEIEQELAILAVHGLLHILGHDHAESAEASLMSEREQYLLSHVRQGPEGSGTAGLVSAGLGTAGLGTAGLVRRAAGQS